MYYHGRRIISPEERTAYRIVEKELREKGVDFERPPSLREFIIPNYKYAKEKIIEIANEALERKDIPYRAKSRKIGIFEKTIEKMILEKIEDE